MGTAEHKQDAPKKVTIAILTLSTTRTIKEDASGQWIKDMGIKQALVLLDACRNDPMAGRSNAPNTMTEAYQKAGVSPSNVGHITVNNVKNSQSWHWNWV